jgi:murein DD-endopeptidase MepM/ murein hydrolase activator NlpD
MHHFWLILAAGIYTVSAAGPLRGASETGRVLASNDFWTVFAGMRNQMVWPTPKSNASLLSGTFGMRIQSSCNCTDFHRGVDINGITGEPVVAVYRGKVVKVTTYNSTGGKAIVLEHNFTTSVNFQGHNVTKWYTNYYHLDRQLVVEGAIVAAGQEIGKLGATGALSGVPHLHHEVLIGTRCSLEFALANPTSTCNKLKVDPHVHPLYIYPSNITGTSAITTTLQQTVNKTRDGQIRVTTPAHNANVNRYEVQIKNTQTGTVRKSHVLDYNLRTGFNPNSTALLDTVDKTKPYLKPNPFGHADTEWTMDLIIPTLWVGPKAAKEVFVVTVTSIWQVSTTLPAFGLNDQW